MELGRKQLTGIQDAAWSHPSCAGRLGVGLFFCSIPMYSTHYYVLFCRPEFFYTQSTQSSLAPRWLCPAYLQDGCQRVYYSGEGYLCHSVPVSQAQRRHLSVNWLLMIKEHHGSRDQGLLSKNWASHVTPASQLQAGLSPLSWRCFI